MKITYLQKNIATVIAVLLIFNTIQAATITWVGSFSNEWNHFQNWSPMIVPSINDNVVIDSTYNNEIFINNANASCKTITYSGAGFNLQVNIGWEFIIAGDLNISGNSKIYGIGGIEIVGNNDCYLNYSDSTVIGVTHINIKSDANVYLTKPLLMPSGKIDIFSGELLTNGFDVDINSISVIDGASIRGLNINNSDLKVGTLTLNVLNGGSFYSNNSIVNNQIFIKTNGIVSFNIINSQQKSTISTTNSNAHITINELNAAGDINILGNTNAQSQSFSIVSFNILEAPCIVRLTPEPYVEGYHFYTISSPNGCNGEILFTDDMEVAYNQVRFYIIGGVNLQNASMANINTVTGSFSINEGTDIGNNTGVIFNQTTPLTYYWINGTGNWNDINHWSINSGGPISGCIPKLKDHVVFDNSSGFTTNDTIYVSHHIFCNDLIANQNLVNKPVICSIGSEQTINLLGSVDLRGFNFFNLPYPITFYNKTSITIQTGVHQILGDIYLKNRGTYQLLNDLNCSGGLKNIYHLLGNLNTNGKDVTVSGFISKGIKRNGSKRFLTLSNSVFHIGTAMQSPGAVVVYSDSLDLNAGTSTFLFEHLQNQSGQFKVEGYSNLQFHNVEYQNQNGTSYLFFNLKSTFNTVKFHGNGNILNGGSNIVAQMSSIDTLIITGNFRYEFEQNTITNIRKKLIHQHGICNELSFITSSSLANKAYIITDGISPLTFENVWLENIGAQGNNIPFEVFNGVDGGNISNFNFLTLNASQIYYWNGESNTSNWSDGNNWNKNIQPHVGTNNDIYIYNTNGCIPGFNDSVVFHENSFPIIDTVVINENANFKGMMWLPGIGNSKILTGSSLYLLNNYGGMALDNNMNMLFDGELFFRSPYTREIIFNQVQIPGNITFYNLGKYVLMDDLISNGYYVRFLAGSFQTLDHNIKTNRLYIMHEYAPSFHNNTIDLGSSALNISNTFSSNLFNNVSEIIANNSHVQFTGSGSTMFISGNLDNIHFGNINYTSNNGSVGLITKYYSNNQPPHFKHVNFEPSGYVLGNNSIDTLVLAEGKDYALESDKTQYINNLLYSKGSPCYRTTITSTIPGNRAYIKNQNCHLIVEHARLRDIEGILGNCNINNYLVGVGGEDLGNNPNWNFIAGNPINGFGLDTTLTCNSLPYFQTSTGFGRYESIVWSNGSTNNQMLIDSASTISAVITYSPTCIINDARIFNFENQIDQSGIVTNIRCNGANDGKIELEISDVDTSYIHTWIYPNNEIKQIDTNLSNLSPGIYTSIITIPGFEKMCSDTAQFQIQEPALLTIQLDTTIYGKCSDPDGIIMITSLGGAGEHSYTWSNGSTTEDIYLAYGGSNQVVVSDTNGCISNLSIEMSCIEHINIPELITPNGDGFGDNWEIIDLNRLYPNNNVKIINRWGNIVYQKKGYNDEFTGIPNTGDTLSIGYLSSGTYFYIIDLGEHYKTLTGYIEIIY